MGTGQSGELDFEWLRFLLTRLQFLDDRGHFLVIFFGGVWGAAGRRSARSGFSLVATVRDIVAWPGQGHGRAAISRVADEERQWIDIPRTQGLRWETGPNVGSASQVVNGGLGSVVGRFDDVCYSLDSPFVVAHGERAG